MSDGSDMSRPDLSSGSAWGAPSGPPPYPAASTPPSEPGVPGSAGPSWNPGSAAGGGAVPPQGGAGGSADGGGGGSKGWFVALAALLVGLLVGGGIGWAVAGGGDDVASGSDAVSAEWQPYCDRAEELVAQGDVDLDDAEQAAVMAELVDLAPERYRGRLDALANIDELDDSDDFAAGLELFGEAFGQMMWFVGSLEVECGLELSDEAFGDMGDSSVDGSFDLDVDDEWGSEGSTGSDGGFGDWDDDDWDMDEGPMSIDALKAHLESVAPDAPWQDKPASWSVFNDADVAVYAVDEGFTTEEALEVCDHLAAYIGEHAPEGTVDVGNGDDPLASGPAGGPCADATTGTSSD